MSKYSIYATKEDFAKAFAELKKLEEQLKESFDWKKIKRVSMDELSTIIGILKRKQKEKLLAMLANAQVTYAQCGGHSKAERNKQRVEELKKQLTEIGVAIPTDKELYAVGVFNGEGAY